MERIDWRSAAVGAALLPLSWLAATLWKARKSVIKPNTSRVPYKVKTCHKPLRKFVQQLLQWLKLWYQVVITGGSKGLGRALADEFLSLGDEVVIASRNASACKSAVAELQQQHPQGTILQTSCDVSQTSDVQQLAAFAQQKLGRIDIWVNNAGVSQVPKASLADTAAEQIHQIVSTNMLGALLGSRIALQTMGAQQSGQTPCSTPKNLFSCLSQAMNMLWLCHALQSHLPQHSAKRMCCVLVACSFKLPNCPILMHPQRFSACATTLQ